MRSSGTGDTSRAVSRAPRPRAGSPEDPLVARDVGEVNGRACPPIAGWLCTSDRTRDRHSYQGTCQNKWRRRILSGDLSLSPTSFPLVLAVGLVPLRVQPRAQAVRPGSGRARNQVLAAHLDAELADRPRVLRAMAGTASAGPTPARRPYGSRPGRGPDRSDTPANSSSSPTTRPGGGASIEIADRLMPVSLRLVYQARTGRS